MEILNSKLEEHTETDEDVFREKVAVALKQINLTKKLLELKR